MSIRRVSLIPVGIVQDPDGFLIVFKEPFGFRALLRIFLRLPSGLETIGPGLL